MGWRSMKVEFFSNPVDFLKVVKPVLVRAETRNSLVYGLAQTLAKDSTSYKDFELWVIRNEGGELLAAALMTPPYPLVIWSDPLNDQAIGELAARLIEAGVKVPAVNGPESEAESFARFWTLKTGQKLRDGMRMRAYELVEVIEPPQPAGEMRQAKGTDAEVILTLLTAMQKEAMANDASRLTLEKVGRAIESGVVYVWEVDHRAVTVAMKSRGTETSQSISGVYTLPEERGKGYASAIVAGLAQMILDDGKRMATLFTDLSNPTSNSIYQKVGFKTVCDYQQYDFVE